MALGGISAAGSDLAALWLEKSAAAGRRQPADGSEDSAKDAAEIARLKARDQEVRAHEAAHLAAGGALAQGVSFTYERGPDGVSYAVSGEVGIQLRQGRTHDETIAIARQVQAAAQAPAEPSPQDHAVAARAAAMQMEAEIAKAKEAREANPELAQAYGSGLPQPGSLLDVSV